MVSIFVTPKFDKVVDQVVNEGKFTRALSGAALAASLFLNTTPSSAANVKQPTPDNKSQTNQKSQFGQKDQINQLIADNVKRHIKQPRSLITANFIKRLVEQESKYNPNAESEKYPGVGTGKGLLQLHKAAWLHADKIYRIRNKENSFFDYKTWVYDPEQNLMHGIIYLGWIERELQRRDIWPTESRIYGVWNAGLDHLKNAEYDPQRLASVNPTFKDNLAKFMKSTPYKKKNLTNYKNTRHRFGK